MGRPVECGRNLKRTVIEGMSLTVTVMVLETIIRTACQEPSSGLFNVKTVFLARVCELCYLIY